MAALTDALGNSVATYAYDGWGVPTTTTESFPGGRSNLFRYDNETGLYWPSVCATRHSPSQQLT